MKVKVKRNVTLAAKTLTGIYTDSLTISNGNFSTLYATRVEELMYLSNEEGYLSHLTSEVSVLASGTLELAKEVNKMGRMLFDMKRRIGKLEKWVESETERQKKMKEMTDDIKRGVTYPVE